MASGTNYSQEYGQAEKAYLESDFAQAAEIIDHLAEEFPNDPNVLLLRGHIYCYGFQNYELARQQYENVLELSQEQDLLDFARSGIEQLEQLEQQSENPNANFDEGNFELTQVFSDGGNHEEVEDSIGIDFPDDELAAEFDDGNFDLGQDYAPQSDSEMSSSNSNSELEVELPDNPFANQVEADLENIASIDEGDDINDPFANFESESSSISVEQSFSKEKSKVHTSSTFMVDSEDNDDLPNYTEEDFSVSQDDYTNDYDDSSELEIDTVLTEPFSMDGGGDYGTEMDDVPESEGLDYQDELEFDEIDSSFFDLEELEQGLPDTGLFNVAEEPSNASLGLSSDMGGDSELVNPDEIAISEASSVTTSSFGAREEPQVEVSHGALAGFINAPMPKKQLITAGVTGIVSAIAVLGIGVIGSTIVLERTDKQLQRKSSCFNRSFFSCGCN